ncbi:MAG: hypothetical protein QOE14_188, partial [Humisphaera sp.]|nr:hypothetical protein [Humisphaera sp.]
MTRQDTSDQGGSSSGRDTGRQGTSGAMGGRFASSDRGLCDDAGARGASGMGGAGSAGDAGSRSMTRGAGAGGEAGGGGAMGRAGDFAGRGPRGYRRGDDRIGEEVCEILTISPDVDASDIDVIVTDGVVTLIGWVDDR